MDPAKAKQMYPDANSTMRVSFGNVKTYSPRDATKYDYVTTMRGVIDKYMPGDYEFDLASKIHAVIQSTVTSEDTLTQQKMMLWSPLSAQTILQVAIPALR